jgi:hypothetical protein
LKSVLLIGSSDKACYNYALSVAQENSYNFVPIESKEFSDYERQFYASNLEGTLFLFYVRDINKLSQFESNKFFETIYKSPHRFILSGPVETAWFIKKNCIVNYIDNSKSAFTEHLKTLLTEPNRKLVRESLTNADVIHLFHTIKYGAWQNPQTLEHMMDVGQNLYKVKKDYILSMLALLPVKVVALGNKKVSLHPLESSILKKIQKQYPKLRESEFADIYMLQKFCKEAIVSELSEDEKAFLGISDLPKVEQAVFTKSIEEFF